MASERLLLPRLKHLAHLERLRSSALLAALPSMRLQLPLLLLLTLLLLVLVYQNLQPLTVAVGPRDQRFISGTHELELPPDIGRWIRWSTSETQLALPTLAASSPLVLDLTLMNSYPADMRNPIVDVFVGERWLTDFAVERQPVGPRQYRLLLPPQQPQGWSIPLTLYSTTIELPQDPRPIGVMLLETRLTALAARPLLPPLWQAFALLLCVTMGYFTLRGIGAQPWLAWAGAALLISALAVGLLFWHLQVAPFTMRLAGLLSLGALYGLAVALLARQQQALPIDQTRPAAPRLSSLRLLLLLGLAPWLMPLYQLVMTADGARNVTPYPPTFWLGAVTLFACLVAIGILIDMRRLTAWAPVLLGILAAAAVAHLLIRIDFALGRSGPDFWILFRGAREWWRGGSMYDLVAVQENHFGHVFKVPPFYGMLFLPFVQQDGLAILFWHRIINIVLLASTLLLLFRAFGVRLVSALGAGLLIIFSMRPATDTIAFGQIDILLLLLLALALVAARQRYDGLAGAAVALGTLFKLYPAVLLLFFVSKQRWRALAGFALAMLLCNGLAIAVVGWEMHRVYLFEVVPRIGGGTSWVENQTVNGFLSRLFTSTIVSEKFDHPLVNVLTYLVFLLGMGGAALLARQPADEHSPRFALQYSLFIILMILTVPAAWMHYQTIIILPFFALLLYSARYDGLPRWRAALLGIAFALVSYGNQWSFFDGTIMGGLTIIGISYKFYGLLLLLAVTVACLRDEGRPGARQQVGHHVPALSVRAIDDHKC